MNNHILCQFIEEIDQQINLCRAVLKTAPAKFCTKKIINYRRAVLMELIQHKIELVNEYNQFLDTVKTLESNNINFKIKDSQIYI